ncbi:MAG TPA: hypothetical protein DHV04_04660 [Flavobacteriaceae bacterium]|nr:hypothetical protein [Flavobacteriaceae bacterium]
MSNYKNLNLKHFFSLIMQLLYVALIKLFLFNKMTYMLFFLGIINFLGWDYQLLKIHSHLL